MHVWFVVLDLVLRTKPRDRLGRTSSPNWPSLCPVGRETLTQSSLFWEDMPHVGPVAVSKWVSV